MEDYDLRTITRDQLLLVLSKAKNEMVKYTRCFKEVEKVRKLLEKAKKAKNKETDDSRLVKKIWYSGVLMTIIGCVYSYYLNVSGKESGVLVLLLLIVGIPLIPICPLVMRVLKRNIKNLQEEIKKYERQLPGLEKEEKEAEDELKALWLIPEKYHYEYALTTMLQYVEYKRASNWERVTDLYETHIYQMTVEENTRITAESSKLQTELARETRNAARWAAAGAWATAAGVWR